MTLMQNCGGREKGIRGGGSGRVQAKRWPHVGGTLNQRCAKTLNVTVRGPRQAPGVLGSDVTVASLNSLLPKKHATKVSH